MNAALISRKPAQQPAKANTDKKRLAYEARSVSFFRGKRQILKDVAFAARPGTITALLGPNGAGKSTALKILCGELAPAAGVVTLNGKALNAYSAEELARQRAILPQHSQVAFPFPVEEIVEMGRHPYREAPAATRAFAEEALNMTDTARFRNKTVDRLSGGEQQRAQLARAVCQMLGGALEGKYLLLDEPSASQDMAQQQRIAGVVRELKARGAGILVVLHDLNQAMTLADEVVLLKAGEVVASGPTLETLNEANIQAAYDHPVKLIHSEAHSHPYIITHFT